MSYFVVTKDGQQASGPFVTREAAETAKANLEIESTNYELHVESDAVSKPKVASHPASDHDMLVQIWEKLYGTEQPVYVVDIGAEKPHFVFCDADTLGAERVYQRV